MSSTNTNTPDINDETAAYRFANIAELLTEVFHYLPTKDLFRMQRVSKLFKAHFDNSEAVKTLTFRTSKPLQGTMSRMAEEDLGGVALNKSLFLDVIKISGPHPHQASMDHQLAPGFFSTSMFRGPDERYEEEEEDEDEDEDEDEEADRDRDFLDLSIGPVSFGDPQPFKCEGSWTDCYVKYPLKPITAIANFFYALRAVDDGGVIRNQRWKMQIYFYVLPTTPASIYAIANALWRSRGANVGRDYGLHDDAWESPATCGIDTAKANLLEHGLEQSLVDLITEERPVVYIKQLLHDGDREALKDIGVWQKFDGIAPVNEKAGPSDLGEESPRLRRIGRMGAFEDST